MRKRMFQIGLVALVLFALAQPGAVAQEEKKDPDWKNLQVFPETMSRNQLKGVMKGFTQQLGVECTHCHVKDEYEKDEKEPKMVARAMVTMMRNLRVNQLEFFPDGRIKHLRCWTCHRGQPEPEEWEPPED